MARKNGACFGYQDDAKAETEKGVPGTFQACGDELPDFRAV